MAEDLLRLGDEQQGWILANEVNKKDPYNVEAYNLVHLHDAMSAFQTLSADGLLVKMDKREAAIYGDKVVELLQQARSKLCEKYGFEPNGPVTVELFPNQQDFAVRTFGMPARGGLSRRLLRQGHHGQQPAGPPPPSTGSRCCGTSSATS